MIVKIAVHYDQERTCKNDNNNGIKQKTKET